MVSPPQIPTKRTPAPYLLYIFEELNLDEEIKYELITSELGIPISKACHLVSELNEYDKVTENEVDFLLTFGDDFCLPEKYGYLASYKSQGKFCVLLAKC
ncbi:hypothetical protein BO71DRAFT_435514 [Aspergillus ellipticus CBS 707.79]|uniref:Uncharacterized protein n=1 Tax=Aspergillus ellipticus CBS 707.79 TaxID=1448320 RepID=A0A319CTW5_9EURO|nr:hypothetical protein BO71DRAFT_435514 [Aspergillus ellipticus CBS 707.79]